jgi:hypothetical protein
MDEKQLILIKLHTNKFSKYVFIPRESHEELARGERELSIMIPVFPVKHGKIYLFKFGFFKKLTTKKPFSWFNKGEFEFFLFDQKPSLLQPLSIIELESVETNNLYRSFEDIWVDARNELLYQKNINKLSTKYMNKDE